MEGKTVLLVAEFSFYSDLSVNDQFLEVLFLAHHLSLGKPKRVVLVLPYMPYGRQLKDTRNDLPGPLVAVGRFCQSIGIDQVITAEFHESGFSESRFVESDCELIGGMALTSICLDAVWKDVLQSYFSPDEQKNLFFLSPDKGGTERAKRVAVELFASNDWGYVEKVRTGADQSEIKALHGDVAGKIVVLVDDIVDTGTTIVHAVDKVLAEGATRVVGCFYHPVFSEGCQEKLEASKLERAWVCDTITGDKASKIEVVSVMNRLAEAVAKIVMEGDKVGN